MPSVNSHSYWAPEDTQAVAKTQDVNDGDFVSLNGNLTRSPNPLIFTEYGWIRTVSVTSSDDLTAVNFHVRGDCNGLVTEEVIAGGNNTTVYGDVAFNSILDIQVTDGNATNVSIGTGNKGFFRPQEMNINEGVLNSFVVQTILGQAGTSFKYSLYFTADTTAINNTISFPNLISGGTYTQPDASQLNKTDGTIFFGIPPVLISTLLVQVVEVTDPASTAKLIFMQL